MSEAGRMSRVKTKQNKIIIPCLLKQQAQLLLALSEPRRIFESALQRQVPLALFGAHERREQFE